VTVGRAKADWNGLRDETNMAMNLPALAIQAFPGPKIQPPLLIQNNTSSSRPGYYILSSSKMVPPLLIQI
jgi:hypothetical protein